MSLSPARLARTFTHPLLRIAHPPSDGGRLTLFRSWLGMGAFLGTAISLVAAPPVITPVADQTVYYGKALVLPVAVDGTGPIQYTVSSSEKGTTARIKTGNPWVKMSVNYPGDGGSTPAFSGDLIFQLFRDMTPIAAGYVAGFAQAGFYDGLKFHRILNLTGEPDGFIAQGGDPNGNGTGGPGFTFENEFRLPLIFVGKGQLAMANSGYSNYQATNGSQFFITSGTLRHLDFAHTIFGQLVRGFDVLEKVMAVPTASGTPTQDVIMTSVSLVENDTDAVLLVGVAAEQKAAATITVTARDANGESSSVTFRVTAEVDAINSPPIVIPPDQVLAREGTSARMLLRGQDLEFDWLEAPNSLASTPNPSSVTATLQNNILTADPPDGYSGPTVIGVGLRQQENVLRSNADDRALALFGFGESQLVGFEEGLTAVAGLPFSGPVARFRDFDRESASGNDAEINWGDGLVAPEPGTITPEKAPFSKVLGVTGPNHTYANPGIYSVVTQVDGDLGARLLIRNRIHVRENADALAAVGRRVTAARGRLAHRLLATFVPPGIDRQLKPNRFTAWIDWGDGTRSEGRIRRSGDGFGVYGTHKYADNQRYAAVVRFSKNGSADKAEAWVDIDSTGLRVPEHLPPFSQAKVAGFLEQTASDPLTFLVRLVSTGNKTAGDDTLDFFLSDDDQFDGSDLPVTINNANGKPTARVSYWPNLPPGATVSASLTGWNAPGGKSFNGRYLIMRVNQTDPLGDLMPFNRIIVSERITSFEGNNPTASFTIAENPTDEDPFIVTVDFHQIMAGFEQSDLAVTNGTVSGFTNNGDGTYAVEIDPANNGNVVLSFPAQAATDVSGARYSNAGSFTVRFDTTAPTPVLSGAARTNLDPFDLTVNFGEEVAGFEPGDVTVTNGTVTSVTSISGSNNARYTVRIDPDTEGPVTVDIAAGVAQDLAGNDNLAATQKIVTFETTGPTPTISGAANVSGNTFVVTVDFDEPINVGSFAPIDVTVGNGRATAVSVVSGTDNKQFSVTIDPDVNGVVTVDLEAGRVQDLAGNGNVTAARFSTTADDLDAPTPVISGPTVTHADPFTVTVQFGEPVTGFEASDLVVGNGVATQVSPASGPAATYTVTVEPAADGPVTIDLPAGVAQDTGGNNSLVATQVTVSFDSTPPTPVITGNAATSDDPFTVTVDFGESVSGFASGDIVVSNGTVVSVAVVPGTDDEEYTVTIDPTADGAVTVYIPAEAAKDDADNASLVATPFTTTYTSP